MNWLAIALLGYGLLVAQTVWAQVSPGNGYIFNATSRSIDLIVHGEGLEPGISSRISCRPILGSICSTTPSTAWRFLKGELLTRCK